MAHIRKQIRDNMITALTGLTTTGSNVFNHRVYTLGSNKLPALCVYTNSDESVYETINPPRSVSSTLTVNVEGYVKATAGYDDTIDAICLEVSEALYADRTRGGVAKDTRIANMTSDLSDDGEQPLSVVIITVIVTYMYNENDLETPI